MTDHWTIDSGSFFFSDAANDADAITIEKLV
jgi:hypothetical protein